MDPHSAEFELYGINPDDPDAGDRLAAARFLTERGVDVDVIRSDTRNLTLNRLVWVTIFIGSDELLTIDEAAERIGIDPDEAASLLRSVGLHAGGVPAITAEDLTVFRMLDDIKPLFGEHQARQVARLLGASTARLAETVASLTRVQFEVPLAGTQPYIDLVRLAEAMVDDYFPRIAEIADRLLRYHLLALTYQSWGVDTDVKAMTVRGVVGFADIVGFTSRAASLSTSGLTDVIDAFEGLVSDAIAHHGGRSVKFIGDEVLFYFKDVDDACACACELLGLATREEIPDVRIAMSYGDVVSRSGDYYGPVVNVASRLVRIADAGTALATQELVDRATRYTFEAPATQELRGVAQPVAYAKLTG
jgi:adenylate cyclase